MSTERCARVIGCTDCGKPAALVGDTVPSDPTFRALLLCPWCLAEARPGAFGAYVRESEQSAQQTSPATASPDEPECATCGGEGSLFVDEFSHVSGHYTTDVPCHDCAAESEGEG